MQLFYLYEVNSLQIKHFSHGRKRNGMFVGMSAGTCWTRTAVTTTQRIKFRLFALQISCHWLTYVVLLAPTSYHLFISSLFIPISIKTTFLL